MTEKIPTTIVTGFLGAGKTTIILHLIEDLIQQNITPVYVKNELGDTTTDTEIIQRTHIRTTELLNGCICCTLTGPFVHAIDELIQVANPDRILIEASGDADPVALALLVSNHPRLTRDGVISVIDVLNFEAFPDLSYTAREQAKFTDLLIFNKVELVSLERKLQVVSYVREVNEYAPIIEAPQGKVYPYVVFGLTSREIPLLSHHHDHHLYHDNIHIHNQVIDHSISIDRLRAHLASLPSSVFRVKGVVQGDDGQWYLVNKVGERVTIDEAVIASQEKGMLLYIGFGEIDILNMVNEA